MSKIEELIAYHRARVAKETGHRYLGWTCVYTPEELITAAGLVPYRIVGDGKPTPLSDGHLQVNVCGFARNCFELALRGDHSFLQGVVMSPTCDTFTKLFDVWRANVKMPFYYQLNTPHTNGERAQRFFKEELVKFSEALEKQFGNKITDDSLRSAIEVHNINRRLLWEISALRKSEPPRVKGSEMLSLTLAAMAMPKEDANRMLTEALALLKERSAATAGNVRLLLTGGPLDDVRLFELLEEMGVDVVADDTCFGSRYYSDLVEPEAPHLEAIAKRYLEKAPCPCMFPGDRTDHVNQLIKEYNVAGVIVYSLKFCDTHLHQAPELQKAIAKQNLPTLFVETDHVTIADGQLKTRIQAFIELINNK